MPDERCRSLDAWLARHHGIVTAHVMASLGFSRASTGRMVDSGRLNPVFTGVYRAGSHPQTALQQMAAVCLGHPGAAIAATTAGQLWGIRGMSDPRIHVLVPHASTPSVEGVVVHRSRGIETVDLAGRRPDGIRLVSPPRCLLDAAAIIGPDATESAVEQLLAEKRCTFRTS